MIYLHLRDDLFQFLGLRSKLVNVLLFVKQFVIELTYLLLEPRRLVEPAVVHPHDVVQIVSIRIDKKCLQALYDVHIALYLLFVYLLNF